MSLLLAVDPGVHGCGVAVFKSTLLVCAAYVKEDATRTKTPLDCVRAISFYVRKLTIDEVVVEIPQVYPGYRDADNNDLIDVSAVSGAVAMLASKRTFVRPRAWKGSVPKPARAADPYILAERAKAKLSQKELASIEWPGSAKHKWDVADAIGIGLWSLKR